MSKIPEQLTTQKTETTFRCSDCAKCFKLPVKKVEPRPEEPHPFEYFAMCPTCDKEIKEAPHIKNLSKAWQNITGTKSPAVSAQNLPVPGGAHKFNALKTGMYAKTASYFPAKTGDKDRYPECAACEHEADCKESGICIEISKVKMLVAHAFDSKDPNVLTPLFQDAQADVFVLLKRMLLQVCQDGVSLEAPVIVSSKDGYTLVKDKNANQVNNITAHPLLKQIANLLQQNGMSLADLQMTPKSAGDQQVAMGHLKNDDMHSMESLQKERKIMINEFLTGLSNAGKNREKDEVFKEQQKQ